MIQVLRWTLLLGGVTSLAISTLLFKAAGDPLRARASRLIRWPEHQQASPYRSPMRVRAWGIMAGGLSLAAAWYLWTPDGTALVAAAFGISH